MADDHDRNRPWKRLYYGAAICVILGALLTLYPIVSIFRPDDRSFAGPPGSTTVAWTRNGVIFRRWDTSKPLTPSAVFATDLIESQHNWFVVKTGRWVAIGGVSATFYEYTLIPTDGFGIVAFLAFFVAAGQWAVAQKKRSQFLQGRCPRCGYDLRATPDRCPECGMEVKTAAEVTDPEQPSAKDYRAKPVSLENLEKRQEGW